MLILARTHSGRPTLQHVLVEEYGEHTKCGLDVSQWSRAYQKIEIEQILCKKCAKGL